MAKATVTLFHVEYRQIDDPLVRDVYAHVTVSDAIRIGEMTLEARQQIARHLREMAGALEGPTAHVSDGTRALLLHSEGGTRLAFK